MPPLRCFEIGEGLTPLDEEIVEKEELLTPTWPISLFWLGRLLSNHSHVSYTWFTRGQVGGVGRLLGSPRHNNVLLHLVGDKFFYEDFVICML